MIDKPKLIDHIKASKDTAVEETVEFLFHKICAKAIEKASYGFGQMSWDVSGYSKKVLVKLLEKLNSEGINTTRTNYGTDIIVLSGW
ncbi:hypothetical protein [Providencia phage PSTCR6]|nr:hypothetical protein [Providencia phage PSTCR6]